MSIRRFLSLSVLSVLAIAGGLFVTDRRSDINSNSELQTIQTGEALQLGVLLTDTPRLVERNRMIINALFRLRDQVNQCGGINQAPVFWAMITPKAETTAHAAAVEELGIQTLLWRKRVHGAIAAFTNAPISHALYSEALNIALEAEVPIISPINSQRLIAQEGRFDQFRRDRPVVTAQTEYWVRTLPNDRQQITAVAQWLQQNNWRQIVTVIPEGPRGDHLAELLSEAIAAEPVTTEPVITEPSAAEPSAAEPVTAESIATEGEAIPQIIPLRYGIAGEGSNSKAESAAEPDENATSDSQDNIAVVTEPESDSTTTATAEPEITQENTSNQVNVLNVEELRIELDEVAWGEQSPEGAVLLLDPDLSILEVTTLMENLKALIDPEQTPIILGNNTDSLWSLLPQERESSPPDFPTPHPLAQLYGLTPHIPGPARQQASQYGLPSPDLRSPPSIFYAWDGAALMMLAAEEAGANDRQAIESALRSVANAPGTAVTDVCHGLERLRLGESINYQGISGAVDIDRQGNVSSGSRFDLWQIGSEGDRQMVETLDWASP